MSELGETLKNAREDKGISLSELQDATKIQKRYLLAIERGEYGQLPGRFYARAFIKSYAEAVGIDPDQLFEQYNSEVPKPQNEIGQLPSRTDRRGSGTARVSRVSGSGGPSKRPSAVLPSLLAAIVIVGLFVIIWMAFQHAYKGGQGAADPSGSQVQYKQNKSAQKKKPSSKKKSQSSSSNTNKNQKSSGSKSNSHSNKQKKQKTKTKPVLTKTGTSNGATDFTLKNAGQFKLKMNVSGGNCWIEVRKSGATGQKIIYKTVQSGGTISKDLSSDKQIYIKVGNAAHVKTTIDGTPLTYPSTNTVQNFLITFNKAKNAS